MTYKAVYAFQRGDVIFHERQAVPIEDPAEAERLLRLGAVIAVDDAGLMHEAPEPAPAENESEPAKPPANAIRAPATTAVGRLPSHP